MRLRPLTQHISGDQRPKQFCPILDGETLLDRTRRRAALLVPEERQVIVVSRPHERYFGDLRASVPDSRLVVQPANRGTGPGILVPLLRIAATAGDVPVIVLPSDHHISDDETLAAHLAAAVAAVNDRPDVVVLLGIVPR